MKNNQVCISRSVFSVRLQIVAVGKISIDRLVATVVDITRVQRSVDIALFRDG